MVASKSRKKGSFGKSKLGSGGRFAACVRQKTGKPVKKGSKARRTGKQARALCAAIGAKAHGAAKMHAWAAKGRSRRAG